MAIYMKLDGIDGDSKDSEHPKWIDVDNISWGANSTTNMEFGGGASGGSSQTQPITVSCKTCSATIPLMQRVLSGEVVPKVEIHSTNRTGDAGEVVWWIVELEKSYISSVQQSGDTGGGTYTSIEIAYKKVTQKISDQKDDGSLEAEKEFIWNVEERKLEK